MTEKKQHPIEAGKGASAVSFSLAVVGVFLPFLTDILYAQIFALFALFMILWLYWSDILATRSDEVKLSHFVAPIISSILILSVAGFATFLSSKKNEKSIKNLSPPRAAEDTLSQKPEPPSKGNVKEKIVYKERFSKRLETYPDIVRVQKTPPVTKLIPPEPKTDINDELTTIVSKDKAGQSAWNACIDKQIKIGSGLFRLDSSGFRIQNEWAYSRNNKELNESYLKWNEEVKSFFVDHKTELPDYSLGRGLIMAQA